MACDQYDRAPSCMPSIIYAGSTFGVQLSPRALQILERKMTVEEGRSQAQVAAGTVIKKCEADDKPPDRILHNVGNSSLRCPLTRSRDTEISMTHVIQYDTQGETV